MAAIRQELKVETKKVKKLETSRKFKRIVKDWQLYSLLILPIIYLLIFKYGPMLGNVIAFRRFMPGGSIFGEEWVGLHYFKIFRIRRSGKCLRTHLL